MDIGLKRYYEGEITDARRKRLEEMAQLYNEGWSKEDIQQESGLSKETINRDIKLMEKLGMIYRD